MDEKLIGPIEERQDRDVHHLRDAGRRIGFPLSLNGLSEGFEKLPEGGCARG